MNAFDGAIHGEQEIMSRKRARNSTQENAISLDMLHNNLDDLLELHAVAATARTEYSDAIKKTAEACGLEPAVLRRYVAAKASDDTTKHKRSADQLVLLFDEVGA